MPKQELHTIMIALHSVIKGYKMISPIILNFVNRYPIYHSCKVILVDNIFLPILIYMFYIFLLMYERCMNGLAITNSSVTKHVTM